MLMHRQADELDPEHTHRQTRAHHLAHKVAPWFELDYDAHEAMAPMRPAPEPMKV